MSLLGALRARIPERWTQRWTAAWPTLRAVLVTFHVLTVFVLSFPSPGAVMQRSSWNNPTVQNEFRLWTQRVQDFGIDLTQKELEDHLWELATRYLAVRRETDAPFRPYAEYFGVRQSWRLFVAPQRYPVRVEVSIRSGEGDTWRLIYQSRSDEHTWRAGQLNRYRLRRAMFQTAWERERAAFMTFCDWIADQAAHDFPDATEVMVRQLRYRTPAPAEARAGETILEPTYLSREIRDLRKHRK
ncbi:hypothetical protein [Chondromyces apiculatus]|uniref:Uncharacterized protein n=1 Tax=Chondromyces apiculatus DSM 436 TaxID=1192034 RepID=A0A017TGE5_9BACT|nr:hypothetical protein [Chondromyces apiculatus]EYF07982.1 Hypothetical protein CAP_7004 [Chondromyces apiculatus DSM 436]